jgi:AraC family transcriptional regulator, regulatory protein of adaptative response / methylated-DNA-[protein]-cysteine methyltransferase
VAAPHLCAMDSYDYERVEMAIHYLRNHAAEQPSLELVAEAVSLSPFHFQRLFTEWAGVSPKKFVQYLTVEHAKTILQKGNSSLLEAAVETGLSGTGRLHHLFVTLEAMTPGIYKAGGAGLTLSYSVGNSCFGTYLIASTTVGVYALRFFEDLAEEALYELQGELPRARFVYEKAPTHTVVERYLQGMGLEQDARLTLHVKATPFQLKVWEALLRIPEGQVVSYGTISQAIDSPGASRAVGTAIGSNSVGYLIPCHRVIRGTGTFGDYRWGADRKAAMLGWEAARVEASAGDIMVRASF